MEDIKELLYAFILGLFIIYFIAKEGFLPGRKGKGGEGDNKTKKEEEQDERIGTIEKDLEDIIKKQKYEFRNENELKIQYETEMKNKEEQLRNEYELKMMQQQAKYSELLRKNEDEFRKLKEECEQRVKQCEEETIDKIRSAVASRDAQIEELRNENDQMKQGMDGQLNEIKEVHRREIGRRERSMSEDKGRSKGDSWSFYLLFSGVGRGSGDEFTKRENWRGTSVGNQS